MFIIQSTKTKKFICLGDGGAFSFVSDRYSAQLFKDPSSAALFIHSKCSVTSRCHVVFMSDTGFLWNVSIQP